MEGDLSHRRREKALGKQERREGGTQPPARGVWSLLKLEEARKEPPLEPDFSLVSCGAVRKYICAGVSPILH